MGRGSNLDCSFFSARLKNHVSDLPGGQNCTPSLDKIHPPAFCHYVTCGASPNATGCSAIALFAITCWRKCGVALHPFLGWKHILGGIFLVGAVGPAFVILTYFMLCPLTQSNCFANHEKRLEPWLLTLIRETTKKHVSDLPFGPKCVPSL